jgi:hypothetical protein
MTYVLDRLIVSVSQNAVIEAESAILGCDQCSPGAKMPFWQILDQLRTRTGEEVTYLLPVLGCCPSCRGEIDEITLVEPKLVASRRAIAPLCEAKREV